MYYRTEISPVELKEDGWNENTLQGIRVITTGRHYREESITRPTEDLSDSTYELNNRTELQIIDDYPSVGEFKKVLQRERLTLLSRRIVGYSMIPISMIMLALRVADGITTAALLTGGYIYYKEGIPPFVKSRLSLPHINEQVIESETKAFKSAYPDQYIVVTDPLEALGRLRRFLRRPRPLS